MDIELKSFPFDSMKVLNENSGELEDDRLYEAQIFRDYFRKFLSNGVYFGNYKNYGENSMKVILDNGLTIKVKKGCGIIEGVDYENESDRLITLERPASGNRVDRIVVQMNSSLDTRKSKLIVKQGNGTTPAELTRTDNIYEICIAEVTVKSTSNISAEDITDTRLDITLCGIVNSLISVSGEELYQQFQAYVRSVEENMMLKNEDIVDGLTSLETNKALSAKQGKLLNDKFAVIEVTLLGGLPTIVDPPEGFTKDNCVIISITHETMSTWGTNSFSSEARNNGIEAYFKNTKIEVASTLPADEKVKIVLMKIS